MDNGLRLGALEAVGVHMGHHIVAHHLFPLSCHIIVDIILMFPHLLNLLIGDVKTQLLLRLCQGDPESSPGAELLVLRKNVLHLPAGIPL